MQFGWSPQVAPLAAALADRLRQRQLDLVGRAYVSVRPATLGALLGVSEAEAAQGEEACAGSRLLCERRASWLAAAALCWPSAARASPERCSNRAAPPAHLLAPAAAAARGWDAADGLLLVKAAAPAGGAGDAVAQHALQRLAEYVVHLET